MRINLWNRNNSFPHGSRNNPAKHTELSATYRESRYSRETASSPTRGILGPMHTRTRLHLFLDFAVRWLFISTILVTGYPASRRNRRSKTRRGESRETTRKERRSEPGGCISLGASRVTLTDVVFYGRLDRHTVETRPRLINFKWLRIGSHRRVQLVQFVA